MSRMEFERIGRVAIDPRAVDTLCPTRRPGVSAAISDISIANDLDVIPAMGDPSPRAFYKRETTFSGLRGILVAESR